MSVIRRATKVSASTPLSRQIQHPQSHLPQRLRQRTIPSDCLQHAMILEHPKLEPFEPLLKTVMDVALAGGMQQLQSDGFNLGDIETNARARNRFIRGCHRGYDKAQVRIAAEVIGLQKQINSLENLVTELRAKHDRDEVRSTVEVVRVLSISAIGSAARGRRYSVDYSCPRKLGYSPLNVGPPHSSDSARGTGENY